MLMITITYDQYLTLYNDESILVKINGIPEELYVSNRTDGNVTLRVKSNNCGPWAILQYWNVDEGVRIAADNFPKAFCCISLPGHPLMKFSISPTGEVTEI